MSNDMELALPARHDREAFVLADGLDVSYSTKYSLQFLQQRFIIPVSYTHLDVYKRQRYFHPI